MPNASSSPNTEPSLSDRELRCPDHDCPLTFSDFDGVYEHYTRRHPLCTFLPGRSKPFKCPFCSKRYKMERFVRPHVNTHRPKRRGSAVTPDQSALILQSHVAVADQQRSEARTATGIPLGHDETTGSEAPAKSKRNHPLRDTVFANDGVRYNSQPTTSHPQQQPAWRSLEPLSSTPELSTARNLRRGSQSDAPPAKKARTASDLNSRRH